MTSIDELFKGAHPSGSKRKLDLNQDAGEAYKASKIGAGSDVKTNGRAPHVEDEDDVEAGPELPPDGLEDAPDDEDGRFFGGGVNKNTAEVLDYIEGREEEMVPEVFDISWLRKLALNFEKRISKNAELRAKFEDNPQKFMSSEADLDADIKALSILSEHTNLYGEFAKIGCVSSLVSLLSHENTDIAIDAIEVINELTDEDVDAESNEWDALVDALLEADILNLLYDNLSRLNEELESDRAGVYHVLNVMENLISRPSVADRVGNETSFLTWLLSRVQKSETRVSQNKEYSAEILTILLQSSTINRNKIISSNGIDLFLQLLSPYRKRDPDPDEEEGFAENIFDSLTCCVDETQGKEKFLESEGVELCLIMLREGKMSKPRGLCVLDHALSGPEGRGGCERVVEAAGLKALFSAFVKKSDRKITEHILGIFSSMLRSLPANDGPRIRLLAKFVEKDYQVLSRLVQEHRHFKSTVTAVDESIKTEKSTLSKNEQEDMASLWLSRRLDAGLFLLQTIDIILAWLIAEDDGARERIKALLNDRDEGLKDLRSTLQEQLEGIDANAEDENSILKDMLSTLMQHLT